MHEKMKAIVWTKYGPPDVLKFKDVEKPKPKANEILIKIFVTSVTAGDWRIRMADPFYARFYFGLFRPTRVNILGFELAGVIEKTGEDVRLFKKGDPVIASTFPGLTLAAHAQYKCLPEDGIIAKKPPNVTYEQAATGIASGGLTALHFMRDKANIRSGQKVLIYGASGSVGTYAIQLAKYYGSEVNGVCSSENLELVKSLGASRVFDYTKEDFTKYPKQYDVVFDAVGKLSKRSCRNVLAKSGVYLNVHKGTAKLNTADLKFLVDLVAAGNLSPVIDKRYVLKQMVEAHRYVEEGHKKGNVIITVEHDD